MSIARVTMHEFNEENMHEEVEQLYKTIVDEYFPNRLEQVINIKTGNGSGCTKFAGIQVTSYPSFESAETTNPEKARYCAIKMMKLLGPYLKEPCKQSYPSEGDSDDFTLFPPF